MKDSVVKRTKNAKLAALIGSLAIKIAQQNNDPLYEKYQTFKKEYLALKKQIIKKYLSQARAAAKKALKQQSKK